MTRRRHRKMKAHIVNLNEAIAPENADGSLWYARETSRVVTKFCLRCYRKAEGIEDDFHFVKVAD